ncbi:MAG: histidine kinase [Bacteroidetes bacterium]|nr:histidine kinase [Bacteroidota bacterium]MCW5896586.1 histidine kinase [Bacteroidota bacterium]
MHPIFADKQRLALYMAAWLVIAGLLCVLMVMMNALQWSEAVALLLPMSFIYAFMCLASLYVCKAFPLQQTPFLKTLSVVVAASFLSSGLWLLVGKGVATILSRFDLFAGLTVKFDSGIPLLFGIGMLLFVLATVVHYLLLAFDSARAAERKALELQVLAREAELKALRSQIQPHFLFNSLNSISALTASDAAAARAMSIQLADFFRTTLKLGQQQFIPLVEEFNLAEGFLSIERVRFGSRLMFEKRLAEGCENIPVPSLILQPIVENAVNHGIAHLVEGGTVTLSSERNESLLRLRVGNPCDPGRPRSKSTGVGLENIRRRLRTLYGDEARLAITNGTHEYSVELTLPVHHTSNT